MRQLLNYTVLILLVFLIHKPLQAQNDNQKDCKDILRRAIEKYDKGHLNEVRTVLDEECIKFLSDPREKEEAYYLLAVANLYMKSVDSARNNLLVMLKTNPEYVCKRKSPVGFQKFYETFRTNPILIFGGKIGLNSSQIHSIRSYSLDDGVVGQAGKYNNKFGLHISGSLTIPIYKRWDIIGELGLKNFRYTFTNKVFGFSDISFQERQTWIELPILARFNFGNHYAFFEGKSFIKYLNPYLMLGGTATYLLGSNAFVSRNDNTGAERGLLVENPNINMSNMRQKFGYYAIGGGGVEYKKGRAIWSVECRYLYGFADVVKAKNRYNNQELLFSYGYVDSDIKFRNLSISVGYAYPIYKPKQQRNFYIEDLSPNDIPQEQPDEEE
jgi:hypothetical protein